jgi:triphosphoribosyl-dephospho-CoA synthase
MVRGVTALALTRRAQPAAAWAAQLAGRAVGALIAEAVLTPKPALVDQRGPGAHRDLDLQRLLASARALRSSFHDLARVAHGRGADTTLREELGALGRTAESRMLRATGGSNAHRGAIWVLGLLVAGKAMDETDGTPAAVAARAAQLARLPDRHAIAAVTHGAQACARYGVRGARGEAAQGFPHVLRVGLPMLQARRAAALPERCAQLDALMAIMAELEDTCLLHRGGWPAVHAAQRGAREVLACGGSASACGWRALLALDAELMRRYASPGGCADLLAACLFLDGLSSPGGTNEPWNR